LLIIQRSLFFVSEPSCAPPASRRQASLQIPQMFLRRASDLRRQRSVALAATQKTTLPSYTAISHRHHQARHVPLNGRNILQSSWNCLTNSLLHDAWLPYCRQRSFLPKVPFFAARRMRTRKNNKPAPL